MPIQASPKGEPIRLTPRRFDARRARRVWRKRLGVEPSPPSFEGSDRF